MPYLANETDFMKQFFAYIKQKIRYNATMEWYNLLYRLHPTQLVVPRVASMVETLEKISRDKCSVSRFGDGEMLVLGGHAIRFQKANPQLSKRLIEVLQSQNEQHLVCLSDTFTHLDRYTRSATRFWRTHFYLYAELWNTYLLPDKPYYNTFITRPYMDFKSKHECGLWFTLLKKIWSGRDIVFIEGEKSRLGVGNGLFAGARSIRRILCPPTSAFDKYDEILSEALKQDKGVLFLIALGPTATVLSYDLFKHGYQAIDAGHVDIEYEWFKMGVTRKVKIPSKYVNEAFAGNTINESIDSTYQKQIICKID
ncbi:MAG: hypothetical protein RL662_1170 [Bacteroidota bacterium]|jgi:glycosyltransferase family protein